MVSERKDACILVAEDDPHTRNLVRELCEGWGYRTLVAADGEEALEQAVHNPDLMLLDLMMPKLDGFEVLRRLRANAATRETAVVMLTAVGDVDGKIKGIELGADDYVTKPFRLAELQRRIEAVLDKRRYRDELRAQRVVRDSLSSSAYPELKDALERCVQEARTTARPLAALFVSLDGYPLAFQPLGQEALGELLREIGGRLQSTLRDSDGIFRIDTETFVLLMPDTTCEAAGQVAERLQRLVRLVPLPIPGVKAPSISVGIAGFPRFGLDKPDDLIRAANQALAQARRLGTERIGLA